MAKVTMICHCGKEYETTEANLDRGWGLSCSKSCAATRRDYGRQPGKRKDGQAINYKSIKKKRKAINKRRRGSYQNNRTWCYNEQRWLYGEDQKRAQTIKVPDYELCLREGWDDHKLC